MSDEISKSTPTSFEKTPEKVEAVRKLARYDEKAKEILERVRRKADKISRRSIHDTSSIGCVNKWEWSDDF